MDLKQINTFYIHEKGQHGEIRTTLTKKDLLDKYYTPHIKKHGELKILSLISEIREDNHYFEVNKINSKISFQ